MKNKLLFIASTLVSLMAANVNASNPASQEYVQAYVQAEIAKISGGIQGPTGPAGAQGPIGPPGASATSDFADFFALMPPDNAATVAVGADVQFPQDGPTSSGTISRLSPATFQLSAIGTYQIMFQVSVTEAGQLDLTLNGFELPYTVVGRATGTSQIVGIALVQTTVINSILTVRNPAGEVTALTITPLAGGVNPVSANLVITHLQINALHSSKKAGVISKKL